MRGNLVYRKTARNFNPDHGDGGCRDDWVRWSNWSSRELMDGAYAFGLCEEDYSGEMFEKRLRKQEDGEEGVWVTVVVNAST